ncbi:hypothetical protein RclHR1_08250010 [Rhizophagus clarus]|uniref:Uncharacterized protein n=1 Tax=Rhizophagus clarus TaxID=94130 RepID=A0A2Z6S6S6_9GLOM|nr:hypothetical protein RclHR1_08250010 [Rhizophagus clarus]
MNHNTNGNQEKKCELYSKVCVAGSIKFVISEPRGEKEKNVEEKFSCNLATILARDREVVAVALKLFPNKCDVYISKNEDWKREDGNYINKIKANLKSISKDAPVTLDAAFDRSDVGDLFEAIMDYCSTKFESRLNKLKNDITKRRQSQYILSFIEFAEFAGIEDVNEVHGYEISEICNSYYKKVKDKTVIDDPENWKKFLRHLRKVGSYDSALVDITACACNEKYKKQFSNVNMVVLKPVIVSRQPIFSWANVIQKFIHSTKEYEKFKKRCLDDDFILGRLKEIYGTDSNANPQLNNEKIEQRLCLHAAMNILKYIIDQRNKNPVFIAVSKHCCYLCELYIKFARSKGYQIYTSGAHNNLYHRWVLPDTWDITIKEDALKYMIADLDRIIREELEHHVDIKARSDSEGESGVLNVLIVQKSKSCSKPGKKKNN